MQTLQVEAGALKAPKGSTEENQTLLKGPTADQQHFVINCVEGCRSVKSPSTTTEPLAVLNAPAWPGLLLGDHHLSDIASENLGGQRLFINSPVEAGGS